MFKENKQINIELFHSSSNEFPNFPIKTLKNINFFNEKQYKNEYESHKMKINDKIKITFIPFIIL